MKHSHRLIAHCALLILNSIEAIKVEVFTRSNNPSALGPCQGDCDKDSHCQDGLYCFQRDARGPVPGCEGGENDRSLTDYCVHKDLSQVPRSPHTNNPSNSPQSNSIEAIEVEVFTRSNNPSALGPCQGDCDKDSHCQDELYCFQRDARGSVPGCKGGENDRSRTDYCVHKDSSQAPISPPTKAPSNSPLSIPTSPAPSESPSLSSPPTPAPTPVPTPAPTASKGPSNPNFPALVSYGGSPPDYRFPLGLCEGDCDLDSQCQAGMICFQRTQNVPVPGCAGNDHTKTDYCIYPDSIPIVNEYSAGKLTVQKLGLLLSEGLDARLIAKSGERVTYADGSESIQMFHKNPDAGATFSDDREDNEGGWIYVSNSEVSDGKGGVGAITFDKDGHIIGYKVLLKSSSMNCGGGRTPWDTWVSCEEVGRTGQIYQVDPTGRKAPQVLTLGSEGGRWESFAYDVRDRIQPRFFVTEDHRMGALSRFTPHNPNWDEPWSMLHGNGEVHYLLLFPQGHGDHGTFGWTENKSRAKTNAQNHYPMTEGIDVNGSQLFFVCKQVKQIFTLDLDRGTYTRMSTVYGLFDGAPDQVERILEGSSDMLYFTEEGGKHAGVHALDQNGSFFTILESPVYNDETTGLSWSPDGRIMYIAYQFTGLLFAIWRRDGAPFHQSQLDVKSHECEI
jgi:hypothetical protein